MRFNDAILGIAFLGLSIAVLLDIQGFPSFPGQRVGPGAFPGLIAVLLAGCSIALIWRGWRERRQQGLIAVGAWLSSPRHVVNFFAVVAGLVFYIAAAETLGFIVCGAIILFGLFSALRVRAAVAVPLAVVITLSIHFMFYKLLRVPLPWGIVPILY